MQIKAPTNLTQVNLLVSCFNMELVKQMILG